MCPPINDDRRDLTVNVSVLRGHRLTGKRVAFRLDDSTLVVNYTALDHVIARFLDKNGAHRFPYERQVRKRLRAALATGDTVVAEKWLPEDPEGRIGYHLASMLEKGQFEIWRGDKLELSVYRVQITTEIDSSRVFELLDCQELLATLDWMS